MLLICFLAYAVSEEKSAAKDPYLYYSICNTSFFLWLLTSTYDKNSQQSGP